MKSVLLANNHNPTINVVKTILRDTCKVEVVKTGKQAINRFNERNYELIILDVELPDMNGFTACSKIRENSEVPIIFLTAAGSEEDKVTAFTIGADDYIVKPFGHKEFVARAGRLLNRKAITKNSVTTVNGISINHFTKEVTVNNEAVHLTPTEFDVLQYMMSNPGVVLSKQEILKNVWGFDNIIQANIVVINVNRIRNKIGQDKIITVRQFGYKLVE